MTTTITITEPTTTGTATQTGRQVDGFFVVVSVVNAVVAIVVVVVVVVVELLPVVVWLSNSVKFVVVIVSSAVAVTPCEIVLDVDVPCAMSVLPHTNR
jgi:magnesium-transporting ATPase (P-type)